MDNFENTFKNLTSIFSSLQDEQSKIIFLERLQYSIDGSFTHIRDMLVRLYDSNTEQYKNLMGDRTSLAEYLKNPDGRDIVLFGVGTLSREIFPLFHECGLPVKYFCDSNPEKQGGLHLGLPVISPRQLIEECGGCIVVIMSSVYDMEIYNQLVSMGVSKDRIVASPVFSEIQYFSEDFLVPGKNEIYIDAGCFDGQNILSFCKWCGDGYEKIFAFEPDPGNFLRCENTIAKNKLKNIELIKKGVWSGDETLHFNSLGNGASTHSESGDIQVAVTSIDGVTADYPITFIKMDVEGAELEALRGAEKTILKNRPKLAICVYHKPEDIITIPLYIKSLIPDYKFYLRHYSMNVSETVLYAV